MLFVCFFVLIIRFITAEMPEDPTIDSSIPNEDNNNLAYFNAVKDNMIHQCSKAINGCLDANNICKRGYGNSEPRPFTYLDENGYPTYRRRSHQDLKVVPHNRDLLLDWNGHINVEYAGTTYTVLYLYKYLFKGNKKEKARIQALKVTEEEQKDEILMYLKGRFICAMDSMWRFFHFQTYPSAQPSIIKINVKLPDHVAFLSEGGKVSDISVYFARPDILRNYKYTEFCHHFIYSLRGLPARFRGKTSWTENTNTAEFNENDFYVDITAKFPVIQYKQKKVYICSKDPSSEKSIVRMNWLYPSAGEIFYLRILLFNRPGMSFEDYKSYEGILHPSFQHSAMAHGYVNDSNQAYLAFQSILSCSSPDELRALVVMLTIEGYPTLCILDNPTYFEKLYEDFFHTDPDCRNSHPKSRNKMLKDLKRRFEYQGKDIMEACGFPMPVDDEPVCELDRHKMMYVAAEQEQLFNLLNHNYPNTDEQEEVFQLIKAAIDNKERLILFIQGSAGTGKSTFAKKVNAYVRSKNLISLGCCANALACQVYGDNGEYTTAHDLFGIPVIEDDDDMDHFSEMCSKHIFNAQKLQLLREAALINWDEFFSNHKHCLTIAFAIMNSFAGQVLLLMGDWRQCPAVVKNATMSEIVSASMLNSPYWEMVMVKVFTINQRLKKTSMQACRNSIEFNEAVQFNKEQQSYIDMLDIIGDGRPLTEQTSEHVIDVYSENVSFDGSRTIALPNIKSLCNIQEAVDWLFPEGFDPNKMHLKAILCSTNLIVDEWNDVIQALNINPIKEYRSTNKIKDMDDSNQILAGMINESVLERYNVTGVPNHILRLKKDDICMLMRNINRKEGLAKNLRVRIVSLHEHCIRVCTLNPTGRRYYNIPRISFTISLPHGRSVKIERKQFPLRLAYSMTYNKSQGQEFEQALVDIRNNPFTHGHLYVALTRVRKAKNVRLFTNPPKVSTEDGRTFLPSDPPDPPIVTNVVYDMLKL